MLVTAVLFSTGGAAVKATQLTAWQIAGGRSAVAALCLLLLLPGARRGWRTETWLIGAAYAATLVLFVHANKLTTAASTIFLQATAPLYLVLLAPLLLAEPVRRSQALTAPLLALGLGLCIWGSGPPSLTAPEPLRGDLLAVASGVCYALVIVGLRRLGRRERLPGSEPGAAAVLCGNLLAAVACLPGALPVTTAGPLDLGIVVFLGAFQIALAYFLMVRALERLNALEGSLLLLLEPVLSPVWAAIVHREVPTVWGWIGGALILSATLVQALTTLQVRRPPR